MLTALGLRPPSADRVPAATSGETGSAAPGPLEAEEEERDFGFFCERLAEPDAVLAEREPAPAVKSTLRSYQKQALHWMAQREEKHLAGGGGLHPIWSQFQFQDGTPFYWHSCRGTFTVNFPESSSRARGGILADAMGLGKTVEALALVASLPADAAFQRRPSSSAQTATPTPRSASSGDSPDGEPQQPTRSRSLAEYLSGARPDSAGSETEDAMAGVIPSKATLVVCPMSLVAQWESEARKHTPGLAVLVYYGADRQKQDAQRLSRDYDIIVTSYGTLSSEYSSSGPGNDGSALFRVSFWRVLLDEAHVIKSRASLTAKACYAIEADRRWVMTGTPIQNKLEDLFSLIRFLRVEPWSVYPYWRDNIQVPFE